MKSQLADDWRITTLRTTNKMAFAMELSLQSLTLDTNLSHRNIKSCNRKMINLAPKKHIIVGNIKQVIMERAITTEDLNKHSLNANDSDICID